MGVLLVEIYADGPTGHLSIVMSTKTLFHLPPSFAHISYKLKQGNVTDTVRPAESCRLGDRSAVCRRNDFLRA
jgi:hypothetical protein